MKHYLLLFLVIAFNSANSMNIYPPIEPHTFNADHLGPIQVNMSNPRPGYQQITLSTVLNRVLTANNQGLVTIELVALRHEHSDQNKTLLSAQTECHLNISQPTTLDHTTKLDSPQLKRRLVAKFPELSGLANKPGTIAVDPGFFDILRARLPKE